VAIQEYPLQIDNYINLGVLYLQTGDLEKSFASNLKALQLQPDDAIALEDGVAGATTLDQPDQAKKYIAEAQRIGLNGTTLLSVELIYFATQSDWTGVQKIIAETAGRPDQFTITGTWANLLPQLGQFQLARTTYLRAADQASSAKALDVQASSMLSAASASWMVDRCFDPDRAAKDALKLDKGKATQIAAANALANCNQAKQANQSLSDIEKRYPQDTLIQELFVPQGRAWLALKAGDAQRALVLLERVGAHDAASFAPYMRGMAYLQLKDSHNAIGAFQSATRLKGAAYFSGSPFALSYLGLGRAYAMAGDKANAKKAYDVFFTEWKNADSDLPVVAEAKKEYAQL
jgi:tetratricopeptide (TPR) repeat protein